MMVMANRRRGFSLVELTVVSVLMAVFAVLLSSAWVDVGRTAAGLIGRSQLVQERDMAVAALSRDLRGCSVEPDAQTGEKLTGRWLKWECPNNATVASNQDLVLFYDGGTDSNGVPLSNTVVRYLVDAGLLKRRKSVNGGSPTDFTVAKNVCRMTVAPDGSPASAVRIVLCFKYRTLTLTCDLTAEQPSHSSDPTLPWSIDHYTNP
jgi:prepilin-type N-terminal cleavage/methylation domain-containing protein